MHTFQYGINPFMMSSLCFLTGWFGDYVSFPIKSDWFGHYTLSQGTLLE
jgi:hypothetical protein